MKRVTAIATATVLALLVALTLTAAAQQPDTRDRTIMTFSSAVELPGMRLEPGTYVFRIADTASRNVIQVLDQEEKDVMGQWLFVPAERQEVTGDTVVTFRETSSASTPAVQYWYYPGEKIGKEFIYPKDQAMRIAQRTGATVQTEEGPVTASGQASISTEQGSAQASVSADTQDSSAQASAAAEPAQEQTSVSAEAGAQSSGVVEGSGLPESQRETAGTSGQSDQVAVGTSGSADANVRQESTVAQNDVNRDSDAVSELPATASPLALSALLGLLSLAGAAGIRSFRL
jgi:hypothetical protein